MGLKNIITEMFETYRHLENFRLRKQDKEAVDFLLENGYIQPCTTTIHPWNSNPENGETTVDLKHYVYAKKLPLFYRLLKI